MALGKGLKGFRVLAVALAVSAPSVAFAHARLTTPAPRVNTTAGTQNKVEPCGALANGTAAPKGQPVAQFAAGATVQVSWTEDIDHRGCYQVRLSRSGNDNDFQILQQVDDPDNPANGATFNANVKLPDGVTCQNCTLQLLQLMNGANPCAPDAAPASATQGVYYSCADIRIGTFTDAGPIAEAGPTPENDAGGTSSSGGSTTTPTDGGGNVSDPDDENGATPSSRNLQAGKGDDCSVGFGATTGVSFFMSTGIAVMALIRRRKKS